MPGDPAFDQLLSKFPGDGEQAKGLWCTVGTRCCNAEWIPAEAFKLFYEFWLYEKQTGEALHWDSAISLIAILCRTDEAVLRKRLQYQLSFQEGKWMLFCGMYSQHADRVRFGRCLHCIAAKLEACGGPKAPWQCRRKLALDGFTVLPERDVAHVLTKTAKRARLSSDAKETAAAEGTATANAVSSTAAAASLGPPAERLAQQGLVGQQGDRAGAAAGNGVAVQPGPLLNSDPSSSEASVATDPVSSENVHPPAAAQGLATSVSADPVSSDVHPAAAQGPATSGAADPVSSENGHPAAAQAPATDKKTGQKQQRRTTYKAKADSCWRIATEILGLETPEQLWAYVNHVTTKGYVYSMAVLSLRGKECKRIIDREVLGTSDVAPPATAGTGKSTGKMTTYSPRPAPTCDSERALGGGISKPFWLPKEELEACQLQTFGDYSHHDKDCLFPLQWDPVLGTEKYRETAKKILGPKLAARLWDLRGNTITPYVPAYLTSAGARLSDAARAIYGMAQLAALMSDAY